MATKKQNIVVFCAHPDDEIFGLGATLAKYSKQGRNIHTVIFSYGEAGLAWLKPEIAIKTRKKETEKANEIIGGTSISFFGLKEGKFSGDIENKKIKSKIKTIISSKKPIKIFTHSPDDPHPDHRAIYHAVIDAYDESKHDCDVYAFDVWNPFTIRDSHAPRLYEDVTNTFNKKIKALKVFKSQKISLIALLWSVYTKAIVHGFHIHKRFSERFIKLR